MASELTFGVLGNRAPAPLAGTSRQGRTRARTPSPMTAAQQSALHELVHGPATRRASRWARPARAGDVAWAMVLVLLLAACIASPLEDLGYLPANGPAAADVTARPHVDERVAYAPHPSAGLIR